MDQIPLTGMEAFLWHKSEPLLEGDFSLFPAASLCGHRSDTQSWENPNSPVSILKAVSASEGENGNAAVPVWLPVGLHVTSYAFDFCMKTKLSEQ